MIGFVYGNREAPGLNQCIGDFVSGLIFGHPGGFKDFGTLGVVDGDDLIAGVVYYDWDPEAGVIQLSAAATSKRWLSRRVLHQMFSIPFDQFGCQLVVLRVDVTNEGMVSIARRYGFDEYRIPRMGGRRKDQFLFTLTDDAWRVHPMHQGRRKH